MHGVVVNCKNSTLRWVNYERAAGLQVGTMHSKSFLEESTDVKHSFLFLRVN